MTFERATFVRGILEFNLEYIISCPKNNHLNHAQFVEGLKLKAEKEM